MNFNKNTLLKARFIARMINHCTWHHRNVPPSNCRAVLLCAIVTDKPAYHKDFIANANVPSGARITFQSGLGPITLTLGELVIAKYKA